MREVMGYADLRITVFYDLFTYSDGILDHLTR